MCGFNPSGLTSGLTVHASGLTSGQASGQASGLIQNQRTEPQKNHVGSSRAREPRETCPDCGRTWPAEYGTGCHICGDRPQRHDAARRPNDKPANPDGYTGTLIRNCPQCHVLERGYADRCQSCDWTRAAWEARATRGQTE